ncbi:MAG: DNA helicase PcrA [Clostridiales bacterium]|nr:DNA helicase PcrA [Clostridiales bacterium]
MDLLEGLNPMQKKAVEHTNGPLLLLAGAGSGKTRVITHRIAYIIERGVSPFNILAITFTNKAAKEMRERVTNLVGSDSVWVSTFHSFCVRVLRREIHKINYENSFSIYDADDALRLIKVCLKELDINEKLFPPKYVMSLISNQKNELVSAEEYANETQNDFRMKKMGELYKLYQKKLYSANALDFDDIIFLTVILFQQRPDVLNNYRNRFEYIMVDEYQDTNSAQYRLIRLLAGVDGNLCVVGDDDQSIYGWRGANILNILNFEKDFPGAEVIRLEQNYRSTSNILNAANHVISNNFNRKVKKLWTDNETGENICYFKAGSDLEEAAYIASNVEQYVKDGGKLNDCAVLYRQNSLSRAIEDMLVKANIPYRIYGGVRFYDRKEIKDVMAYLKAIYNAYDDIAYRRVINTPKRGIGDTTVDKISQYCAENDISFFAALNTEECLNAFSARAKKIREFYALMSKFREMAQDTPVSLLIKEIVEQSGYAKELEAENTDEAKGRLENIDELINKAVEFESQSEDISLAAFLEEVSLIADIDEYSDTDDTISLMTLHSSKGLEFKRVFIAGFEEGIFPGYRAVTSGEPKELEEERRLCYVGITRAKERLYFTSANQRLQHGQFVYNSPSRFLKELPNDLLDTESYINRSVPIESKKTYEIPAKKPEKAYGQVLSRPFGINNKLNSISGPKDKPLDFAVGDNVRQLKYGEGRVTEIKPAGADYEVTVEFSQAGVKKFMAHLSKLVKVD